MEKSGFKKKSCVSIGLHKWEKNLNMTNTGLEKRCQKCEWCGKLKKWVAAKSENHGHRRL
jgi:hypothetical protein